MEMQTDTSAQALVETFGDKAFTRAIICAWQSADFHSREYWLNVALEISKLIDRVQQRVH